MRRSAPSILPGSLALPASVAAIAVVLGLAGCGGVVIEESGFETTTGTTTETETTTSETTSTTTTIVTTTDTFCTCELSADCPMGLVCDGCNCIQGMTGCGDDCVCVPGETADCYSGPPGTIGVGVCHAGTRQCLDDGSAWGPCEGEVLPSPQQCDDLDEDCDGIGGLIDIDGDGWTACDGDCCEDVNCAPEPELVNPGAMEYPGDAVDNDCNPASLDTDPYPQCSPMPIFDQVSSIKLLKAMDLCMFTPEDPPHPQATWGVISGKITLADGSEAMFPPNVQMGVLGQYGPNVPPRYGLTMAALSTGTARALGDPGYVHPQNGDPGQNGNYLAQTSCAIPPDWLAANGAVLPGNCPACQGPECGNAHDSVALSVRIRVPTNAKFFSYDFDYYTAEYPENICSSYDDFFIALITSQAPAGMLLPGGNIAWDSMHQPVSSNTAHFDVCSGCAGGTVELEGNGMGGWDGVLTDGAATGWQRVHVPVVPGEKIDLRFIVWDAIDGKVDSLVLLDRARFLLDEPIDPGP